MPAYVEDRLRAPQPPAREQLRDRFFETARRWSFGLVRGSRWRLSFGPLTLLRFGAPELDGEGWRWPIEGGLLAATPGGRFQISWDDGELVTRVEGYRPLLPEPIYSLLQVPFHHLTTRLFLLQLRGLEPQPGKPATEEQRVLALAVDAGICFLACRKRRLRAAIGFTAAYHVAFWCAGGRTPGALVAGTRVVSVDGSAITPGQAIARLLGGDAIAGTMVVDSSPGGETD